MSRVSRSQSICLNMIVKNEAPVIRRCLESVLPVIDYWAIVDTGSSDDTIQIVRDCLRDVPGELHEHPWVDFSFNRTQALGYLRESGTGAARCDYALLMDADHVLGVAPGFTMPAFSADGYLLEVRYGGTSYLSKRLIRCSLPWHYTGVLHEYLTCEAPNSEEILPGLYQTAFHDGARAHDPLTYRRDALVLEQALIDEPRNARYVFYLAQSYRDAGDPVLALRHYRRRVEMGGWREEVWVSLYQIAGIEHGMARPWPEVLEHYLAAYQHSPDRAEPLFRVGLYYQGRREYHTAHLFLDKALRIPRPAGNRLFVEVTLYDYLIALECAVACYWLGDDETAIALNDRLLHGGLLPTELVDRVVENRKFSLDRAGRQ